MPPEPIRIFGFPRLDGPKVLPVSNQPKHRMHDALQANSGNIRGRRKAAPALGFPAKLQMHRRLL